LAPAFIIEKVEIEDLADRLADAVEAVTADLSPGQGVTDWQGSGVAA